MGQPRTSVATAKPTSSESPSWRTKVAATASRSPPQVAAFDSRSKPAQQQPHRGQREAQERDVGHEGVTEDDEQRSREQRDRRERRQGRARPPARARCHGATAEPPVRERSSTRAAPRRRIPRSRRTPAPHRSWVRRAGLPTSTSRTSPRVSRLRTASAQHQSSLSGNRPRGSTARTTAIQSPPTAAIEIALAAPSPLTIPAAARELDALRGERVHRHRSIDERGRVSSARSCASASRSGWR